MRRGVAFCPWLHSIGVVGDVEQQRVVAVGLRGPGCVVAAAKTDRRRLRGFAYRCGQQGSSGKNFGKRGPGKRAASE